MVTKQKQKTRTRLQCSDGYLEVTAEQLFRLVDVNALDCTYTEVEVRRILKGSDPLLISAAATSITAKKLDAMNVDDTLINPPHYKQGSIEVIEAIEGLKLDQDFYLANIIKYVCRSKYKSQELLDLKKAQWYLERKIEKCKDQQANS